MATTYTYDATTGTYILSDTGTFVLDDAGAYVQSLSVSTDLADYAPGSTATFTANVDVGDTVTFNVTDVAGTAVSGTSQPWTITDGGVGDLDGVANGVIQTNWAVGQDAAGQAFVLTATDTTTGAIATTAFTDSVHFTPVDAVAPDGTNEMIITTAGALSTGSGIFPAFVQLQGQNNDLDDNPNTETGYNPATPPVDNSGSSGTFNHPIQVSQIPTETDPITGVTYFVFRLDLNEPNNGTTAGLATLNSLKLYFDGTGTAGPTASGTPDGATPLYDMDTGVHGDISIVLADWSSGSGHGDYVFKIPVDMTLLSPDSFIYLFSSFSNAQGGFEEWALGTAPPSPPPPPPPTPHATLFIDKEVVCADDQDVISNGIIRTDSHIQFTYSVTATSDAVSGVVIVDDNGTPSTSDDLSTTNGKIVAVLGADNVHNIGDTTDLGVLDVGETWLYESVVQSATTGTYTNNVKVDGTSVQDQTAAGEGIATSGYFGVDPEILVDKKTNGIDHGLNLLQGQAITWTYDVTLGAGNVDLTNIVLTDDHGTPGTTAAATADDFHPTAIMGDGTTTADSSHNIGDTNNDGILETGETWHYFATAVAGNTAYSNTVTVTAVTSIDGQPVTQDACENPLTATATDTSDYTGHGQTLAGLTKGYWANHSWTGIDPSTTKLILGDVNTDGVANDGAGTNTAETSHLDDLCLTVAVAQALANSSSTTDARIILASQLVAAQMNDYNDAKFDGTHGGITSGFEASPNGLIEEGVQWLTGNNFGSFLTNVDALANVDTNHNGQLDSTEYSIAKNGSISFSAPALSSSGSAWHTMQTVFDETAGAGYHPNTGNATVDALQLVVKADGEGLKNALAAYNHGLDGTTAGFVVSTDGSLIGWQNSLGGTVYDVHANTANAFWGILEDQNQLSLLGVAGAHSIVGVGV